LVKRLREGGEIGVVGSENVLASALLKTAAPGYGGLRRVCCRRVDAARGDLAARRNAAGTAMTGAPPAATAAAKPLWDWSSEGWDAQVAADTAVKASVAGPWNTTVPDLPAANVAAEAGAWAANASATAAAQAAHPAYPRGAKPAVGMEAAIGLRLRREEGRLSALINDLETNFVDTLANATRADAPRDAAHAAGAAEGAAAAASAAASTAARGGGTSATTAQPSAGFRSPFLYAGTWSSPARVIKVS
jgi:hypothetical protein